MARPNIFDVLSVPAGNPDQDIPPAKDDDRPFRSDRPFASTERKSRPTPQLGLIQGAVESAGRVEEIERKLAQGQSVVDLDPADIDASFVPDRMAPSEEAHRNLVASIQESGQQVPILVRPHPETSGRYQIAYGHRRVRALKELGLKVRAVVRDLTDEQLVVAQGQENNERTNLTFIERARFAKQLEDRKFPREVISRSLCIDKANISRLISVASRIPLDIIDAIGPAPTIGQGRWMEFADLLDRKAQDKIRKAIAGENFASLIADARFDALYGLVKVKSARPTTEPWTAKDGLRVAKVTRSPKNFSLSFDEKVAPEFGEFVLEKLEDLYTEFKTRALEQ
ncbi:plasmid partitioning protein RepB [Microvirga massiliensis]|uniref:plasmid partitioning protein RepB n=1 Tax=Microvirga massiliensis TaxID=1033741 RepID=UPI00062BC6D6|nr:plasmid partitioning protein RepB [Microvirga massiliensis]